MRASTIFTSTICAAAFAVLAAPGAQAMPLRPYLDAGKVAAPLSGHVRTDGSASAPGELPYIQVQGKPREERRYRRGGGDMGPKPGSDLRGHLGRSWENRKAQGDLGGARQYRRHGGDGGWRHRDRSHRHDRHRYRHNRGYTTFDYGWGYGVPDYWYEPEPYYDAGLSDWDLHVAWCHRRYRSYNERRDAYKGYDGKWHRCRSPYSR